MNLILPLLPILLIGVLLEVLVRTGVLPSYLVPSTSEVLRSLWIDRVELLSGFAATAIAAISGLVISLVLGLFVAIGLSLSSFLRRALLPYAIFFQTVPIIALAPVLVIWFGFGRPTVVASAFIVSVFPMIANTISGLQAADPRLVDFFKLFHASRWQILWKLRLPTALPMIFTGLKVSAGLAVIGAVVGEFVAGGGLGEVVDAARTQQRLDKVFAAVLLSSFLGLALVAIIDLVSKLSLKSWSTERSV
ncbi:MAG: ABC transporter permease [Bdellovibrionales bacterium]|nr:ABC transporter permease [Bdellovibrionales bacterium]